MHFESGGLFFLFFQMKAILDIEEKLILKQSAKGFVWVASMVANMLDPDIVCLTL